MIAIGVTGSFGTGKTTVAKIFSDFGIIVIDADKIAHQFLTKGTRQYKEIVLRFGENILNKDKSINRRKLAEKVFGNRRYLQTLCDIIHPPVIENIKRELNRLESTDPNAIVIIDAPLLIEVGLDRIVNKIIVVKTNIENQLARGTKKTGLTENQIRSRIRAQLPMRDKEKLADYVIDNNGTLRKTKKQAEKIWNDLIIANCNLE